MANNMARIRRHDDIVINVKDGCSGTSLITAQDQVFDTDMGGLRPYLVVLTGEKGLVVDVTVRFEQKDSLLEVSVEKKSN